MARIGYYAVLIIVALAFLVGPSVVVATTPAPAPTPSPAPWVPAYIPERGVVLDGTLYCPRNTKANKQVDACIPL
jgi:hypothetical protein